MAERKYKHFKVSEVFGPAKLGKYHNPKDLVFDNNGYYYICASNKNNGVNQKMPRVNGKNLYLTPQKIVSWGKQCPKFTYHDEPCVTGQGMYYLDMTNYNEETALYLCAVLAGACKDKYNYSNCLIGSVMNDVAIPLPVTATGSIDWDFMTDYIRELEQERIRELDAYLKATGLDSYELNAEDKRVLALYREALEHKDEPEKCELQFGEFKLGELFDATVGDTDIKRSDINGRGDFVATAGVANCGILGKSDVAAKVVAANTITVDMFGNCQYRDFPYKMATHARVFSLKSKTEDFNRETGLYISTVLRSVLTHFDYNNMCSWNKISDFAIQLPVTASGDINFDFMEKYIKAIEKVSIANVVKYKNKVIAATKQVVNGNSVSDAAAA